MAALLFLTYNGETLTISEWGRRLGIHRETLRRRMTVYGWTVHRALSTPVGKYGHCNRAPAPALSSALKRVARNHHASERAFLDALQNYVRSCSERQVEVMDGIDMSMIGQPPAGTFKTPGVVTDFAEKPSDRSLSVAQDLT